MDVKEFNLENSSQNLIYKGFAAFLIDFHLVAG